MDSVTPAAAGQQATKERFLRQFEVWLDRILADEEPPQGIAAELLSVLEAGEVPEPAGESFDLYSLWAAMTALTQEVKLQGRAFRQLSDTLTPVADLPAALPALLEKAVDGHSGDSERERTLQQEAEQRARQNVLDLLLDLRDRLQRGTKSVQEAGAGMAGTRQSSWRTRLFGPGSEQIRHARETLAALEKGYSLGLDRLDQALSDFEVRPIPAMGLAFDPRLMNAVEIEETGAAPDGTVLEVYRNGYEWNGKVYRPAQVKVAKAPVRPQ
jgi:molecular chaperone GrpE